MESNALNDVDNNDIELSDIESSEDDTNQDINFDPITYFTKRELYHYKMIDKFYKKCTDQQIQTIKDIIDGISNISLRVLDWVVTRYSKKQIDYDVKNCDINDFFVKDKSTGEIFDIHISYKAQLKSYKKRYFDPFKRRKKFTYSFHNGKTLLTTLGQLNFFKWAITTEIITFVDHNLNQIINSMYVSNNEDKKKKEKKKQKKDVKETIKPADKDTLGKITDVDVTINSPGHVNIKATKTIEDDEVQIILSFD